VPTLHSQFAGTARQPDGTEASVPSQVALALRGPCVQVSITIAEQIATQLLQQGKTLEPPVSGLALIDTGASTTCIDEAAAKKLRLPIVNVVKLASASYSATPANVYPIRVEVAGLPISFNAPMAIGAPLNSQGLIALIGRDLLLYCTLFYNGISGQITLSI